MKLLVIAMLIASPALGQIATDPAPAPIDPLEAPSPLVVEPPAPAATGGIDMGADVPTAKAVVVNEREAITQLQVFLDRKMFGPGKIDGAWGEFTAKALQRYEAANGLPVTPDPQKLPWEEIGRNLPLDEIGPIYTQYEIKPDDLKFIGNIPRSYDAQAKLKRMPYESLLEFVSERFHADPSLLVKLNERTKAGAWKPGDVVWVPNVEPFRIEDLKEVAKLPKQEEHLARTLHIDTSINILELREGDTLLASVPITPGSATLPAPKGTWKILGITEFPWFRRDEKMLKQGIRSDKFHNLPPGPNSPVGVIWMGLNKPGIGIHGTNNPNTIGRAASHGCVRVANWDVIRLARMVSEGMTVQID